MKLFLCSHFSSVGSLIKEEIENKKVAFIPTASLREGYTGYVGSARKLFKKLGAIVTEIDISTEAYSTIQSVFEEADVIYFTGGNSFFLMDQLRKTGTDGLLKKELANGKLMIGESAGAIICAPSIQYIEQMDEKPEDYSQEDDAGLDLIDFYVLPHYLTAPFKKVTEKIMTEFSDLNLCPITTIEAIKAYRRSSNSLSSGQVLHCPYEPEKARLVVREMTDLLVLDLVDKGLVTDQMVLTVGYDIENLTDPARRAKYHGAIEKDPYGREIPKQAHGSINLDEHTSSTRKIMCAVSELFDRIVDKNLLVRRMYVVANHVLPEADAPKKNDGVVQLDLFTDYAAEEEKQKAEDAALERERKIQAATLEIKKKYGKNAILKAMNLEEGATAKDRNAQIGGHKA